MNTRSKKLSVMMVALCVLFALLAVPAMAGGAGESTASNHFTLYFPGMTTPINLDGVVTQALMKASGIVWDRVEIGTGSDMTQQVNLKLAGGALSDAITMDGGNVLWGRLVKEKKLVPLDKYFNDRVNYPNLAKIDKRIIDYWRASDGHIYFVPQGYEPVLEEPSAWTGNSMGLWVRDDTLKLAGMKYEDLKTLTGFEAYLTKLKGMTDSKGRKIIPLSLGGENFDGLYVVMSMFGVVGGTQGGWNEQPDGTVIQDYQTPGFKQAWQWLNKMYRGGLLDPETPTQKNDLYNEKRDSLRYASFLSNPWNYPNAAVLNEHGISTNISYADLAKQGFPEDWYNPTYLPHNPGVKLVAQFAAWNPFGGNATGVTTSCKNPDRLMKGLDWMNSPEANILMWWGPEPLGAYTLKDGVVEQHNEVFVGPGFRGGATPMKNVTEKGFWWWGNVAGIAQTHVPVLEPPWIAENTLLYKAEQINHEQGAFGLVSKAARIRPVIGGAVEKYTAVQNDIRLQYYAKMMMASTDSDFDAAHSAFISEMKVRGHDAETIAEFNELYKNYSTTPAGKVAVTIRKYLPRNVFSDKPEVIGR